MSISQPYIHCDDLAASAGVNESMFELLFDGTCSSFSVLGNGFGFNDLWERLANRGDDRPLTFWVHLNLSEGHPAAEPDHVSLLLNEQGRLHWSFGQVAMNLACSSPSTRFAILKQIEIEWRAQVHQVTSLTALAGITIAGVDGHQHVHSLPPLFHIADRLRGEMGLGSIRIPAEVPHFASRADLARPRWWIGLAKLAIVNACLLRCDFPQNHQRFVGLIYSGRMTRRAAESGVSAHLRRSKATSPIMVLFHPCSCSSDEVALWVDSGVKNWYSDPARILEVQEARAYGALLSTPYGGDSSTI